MFRRIIFLAATICLTSACQTSSDRRPECGVEIRAAFDVGSGSTKMKVAEINTCSNKVVRVLLEEQQKVDYRQNLETSENKRFSEDLLQEGLETLRKLKAQAVKKKARKFTGVATAAFRQARNSEDFIKKVREKLNIPLRVITQDAEALIGFQAAVLKSQSNPNSILMWDIGGGSQQMVTLDDQQQPVIYFGELASVSFKNQVIEKIQKKDIKKVSTPNPLKKSDLREAVTLAEKEAVAKVPRLLKKKINEQKVTVLGIGGVLAKSIGRQIKGPIVKVGQLRDILDQRVGLTDKDIKDPYASTEITNLALVYGYMKALGIESYQPIDVSLIDGLWFQKDIWQ